jgi:excisionase family DNA binding protein
MSPNMKNHQETLLESGHAGSFDDPTGFEPLLDTEEAAKLLRIHPKTLRRNALRGEIPATRIGRLWRFRVSVLNEWLDKLAG